MSWTGWELVVTVLAMGFAFFASVWVNAVSRLSHARARHLQELNPGRGAILVALANNPRPYLAATLLVFRSVERLGQTLRQRPPGATTVDALRDFLSSLGPPDEGTRLRKQLITANEHLRLSERARMGPVEELIADSIARDLDAGPDDVRPLLIAASVTAAFGAVRERLLEHFAAVFPFEPSPRPTRVLAVFEPGAGRRWWTLIVITRPPRPSRGGSP